LVAPSRYGAIVSEVPTPGSRRVRLGVAALVIAAGVAAYRFGLLDELTIDNLRTWAKGAGWWGPPVFVLLFAIGEILHVPSVIFVVVASIVWPLAVALPTAYLGAMTASAVVFLFARFVVGEGVRKLVHDKMPPEFRRYDDALEERGFRTVALIRLVTFMAPLMHWVLATSRVRFGTMMAGTAVGLLPGISALVVLGERAVHHWEVAQPYVYGAVATIVVVQALRVVRRRRAQAASAPADVAGE
jgi:uncharacterized membrane protein YdjX (TVP38/TMEM64 family)